MAGSGIWGSVSHNFYSWLMGILSRHIQLLIENGGIYSKLPDINNRVR